MLIGLVIELASDADMDAALALAGAPVPQGATPAASSLAVLTWAFTQIVAAVGNGCRIPLLGGAHPGNLLVFLCHSDLCATVYLGSLKPSYRFDRIGGYSLTAFHHMTAPQCMHT